jgi:Tfp pilus assembly protein PilV
MSSKGFSLIEAMLSGALFSVVVTAFAGAMIYGQQSTVGAGERSRAMTLAEEGTEAVRSIRDQALNELQYNQSGVQISGNTWAFLGEGSTETIDEYTRTTTFADVCRDGSKVIAACPSSYTDPHTKQVTVTVTWSNGPTALPGNVSRVSYLTDWEASNWTQTDWSGGSAQTLWSDITKYDTDDTNVLVSTAGEVTLKPAGGGSGSFVDDTQPEFDAGSYTTNTQYNLGSSWVDLTAGGKTAGTGSYTSSIQDAGGSATWTNLGWLPNRPTGKELPDSGATETGYPTGNLAMTNNWGLYHLNGASGATTFADTSGNVRTGSCAGASCPTSGGAGKFLAAPDFDGFDDIVGLGTSEITGTLLTLSAWVKPDAYGTDPFVISKANGTGSGNMRWMLGFNNLSSTSAQVSFGLRTGSSTTTLNTATSYGVGAWMHIVARYDGATMKIYVNGTQVATTAKTGSISTTGTITTRISGRDGNVTSRPFNGKIDEVGIWNRALSPTEINDAYQRGALDLKYQVRSCNDNACAGETFIGPDGTGATYYSELMNTTLTPPILALSLVPANQYFQYQTSFVTSDSVITPELKTVTIDYTGGATGFMTAGWLQSSAINLADASPVENIEWDQVVPSCSPVCTVRFQVRTAPNAAGVPGTWTAWYGATGSGTYFTVNTGQRIPVALNGNQWVQYRVELAGDGTSTPTLQELRLFYR